MGVVQQTNLLIDRVYHGTRPLLLDDGRAIVQRGTEGSEPSEEDLAAGRMRVDHLTIEQVDLSGNQSKVLSRFDGYIAFIAGVLRHEVFVYRVGPDGADIIGVDADSGRERTIVRPLPPYARDFSVDAQGEALLFTEADPGHPGQWVAQRLSVAPPAPSATTVSPASKLPVAALLERLATASHPGMAPTAWIGRGIALNKDLAGLQISGGTSTATKAPFATGVDLVREFFIARNDTWALAMHHVEGQLPEPVVIHTGTMNVQRIAAPAQALVDLAGVLEPPGTPRPQIRQLVPAIPPLPIRIDPRLFQPFIPKVNFGGGAEESP